MKPWPRRHQVAPPLEPLVIEGFRSMPNDIVKHILQFFRLDDLMLWRTTSVQNCRMTASSLTADVNMLLAGFVDVPNGLRATMRATRSVISGSSALKIVDREATFQPNNLDIYVTSSGYRTMLSYLTGTERYIRVAHADVPLAEQGRLYSFCGGVASITKLIRQGRRINIICSMDHSPTTPIPYFWSTLLMNFITADSICCGYPTLTLKGYALLHIKRCCDPSMGGAPRIPCLEKYTGRGYEFSGITQPEWDTSDETILLPCAHSWVCRRRNRFFGDGGCVTINLACHDSDMPLTHRGYLDTPSTPPFGLTNNWRIGGPACGDDCQGESQADVDIMMLLVTSLANNVHFIQ